MFIRTPKSQLGGTVPALFLRFAQARFRMLVYDPIWPAVVKSAIAFAGTLSASWLATMGLRGIPIFALTI